MSFENKLIKKVKENDCIYNIKSKLYKNPIQRDLMWAKIAEELGERVENCKQRWKSLRDRYVREKKNYDFSSSSGSGASNIPNWQYYGMLDFLQDSIRPKRQDKKPLKPSFKNPDPTLQLFLDEFKVEDESINSTPELENIQFADDLTNNSMYSNRKRHKSDADDDYKKILGDIKDVVQMNYSTSNEPDSENNYFFKMIKIKVDSLPKNVQNDLQIKILTMVNEEIQNNE